MKEITGNIWEAHELGHWVVITTNGIVNSRGRAVMGRGVALQAALRFPALALDLGERLRRHGNWLHWFPPYRIVTFPVKEHWRDQASFGLIARSAKELSVWLDQVTSEPLGPALLTPIRPPIFLVRPGCGNGGLDWSQVKPMIEPLLDNRFVVVER